MDFKALEAFLDKILTMLQDGEGMNPEDQTQPEDEPVDEAAKDAPSASNPAEDELNDQPSSNEDAMAEVGKSMSALMNELEGIKKSMQTENPKQVIGKQNKVIGHLSERLVEVETMLGNILKGLELDEEVQKAWDKANPEKPKEPTIAEAIESLGKSLADVAGQKNTPVDNPTGITKSFYHQESEKNEGNENILKSKEGLLAFHNLITKGGK